jgi:hypothetical protein
MIHRSPLPSSGPFRPVACRRCASTTKTAWVTWTPLRVNYMPSLTITTRTMQDPHSVLPRHRIERLIGRQSDLMGAQRRVNETGVWSHAPSADGLDTGRLLGGGNHVRARDGSEFLLRAQVITVRDGEGNIGSWGDPWTRQNGAMGTEPKDTYSQMASGYDGARSRTQGHRQPPPGRTTTVTEGAVARSVSMGAHRLDVTEAPSAETE